MKNRTRVCAAAVLVAASTLTISTTPAATADESAIVSPQQLAIMVERINDSGFGDADGSQRRSPRAFLPRALTKTDTSDEMAFIASEVEYVDSMDEDLGATQGLTVEEAVVTVDTAKLQGGLNLVTLHVARTLSNGVVWEEMAPYAIGQENGPLDPGQIVRMDLDALANGEIPQTIANLPGVPKLGSEKVTGRSKHSQPSSIVRPPSEAAEVPTARAARRATTIGSTGRARVADYALTYALNRNGNYYAWDNDCTNFISQAVYKGGWSENLGWYQNDGNWWYTGSYPIRASYTWAGAENWYRFARNESGRAAHASNVYYLRVGDILQYKAAGASNMTHSMVVTKKVDGVPYLSYHTNDTKNKPFTLLAGLNVTWFGHYI